MERMTSFTMIIALVLSMLVLTACGKSEFGLSENTEKKMPTKMHSSWSVHWKSLTVNRLQSLPA